MRLNFPDANQMGSATAVERQLDAVLIAWLTLPTMSRHHMEFTVYAVTTHFFAVLTHLRCD